MKRARYSLLGRINLQHGKKRLQLSPFLVVFIIVNTEMRSHYFSLRETLYSWAAI